MVLAALLRLSTLDLQSFWYDEAYVPVHTLHLSPGGDAALGRAPRKHATAVVRVDLGVVADLRHGDARPAAALGVGGDRHGAGGVGIGQRLAGRRAAIATAAFVATSPLFVWYSQEARAYGLFVLMAALRWVLAARRRRADAGQADGVRGERRGGAGDALLRGVPAGADVPVAAAPAAQLGDARGGRAGAAAPRCRGEPLRRRAERLAGSQSMRAVRAFAAVAAIGAVGAALVPLALTQGGHGSSGSARALASRLETIPQYYLTGYSGGRSGTGWSCWWRWRSSRPSATACGGCSPRARAKPRCWRWGWRRAAC